MNQRKLLSIFMATLSLSCSYSCQGPESSGTPNVKTQPSIAEPPEAAGLRRMLAESDCVVFGDRKTTDPAAIRELAEILHFTRIGQSCECDVWPGLDFYRKNKMLATITIHHDNRLRSGEDNRLWSGETKKVNRLWDGDLILTPESSKQLKQWMERRLSEPAGEMRPW